MSGSKSDIEDGSPECQIMEHATALFCEFGYGKTNIGDIAKRVGMSSGNLYRYFRNKQAIGEEVVRWYLSQSELAMQMAVDRPGLDHEQKLRAVFHIGIGGLIQELRKNPRLVELAEMICESNSGILPVHLEWKVGLFERLLREGAESGAWHIADPAAAAETLLDATRAFWMPFALAQLDLERVPARVDAVLDAVFAGYRVR